MLIFVCVYINIFEYIHVFRYTYIYVHTCVYINIYQKTYNHIQFKTHTTILRTRTYIISWITTFKTAWNTIGFPAETNISMYLCTCQQKQSKTKKKSKQIHWKKKIDILFVEKKRFDQIWSNLIKSCFFWKILFNMYLSFFKKKQGAKTTKHLWILTTLKKTLGHNKGKPHLQVAVSRGDCGGISCCNFSVNFSFMPIVLSQCILYRKVSLLDHLHPKQSVLVFQEMKNMVW